MEMNDNTILNVALQNKELLPAIIETGLIPEENKKLQIVLDGLIKHNKYPRQDALEKIFNIKLTYIDDVDIDFVRSQLRYFHSHKFLSDLIDITEKNNLSPEIIETTKKKYFKEETSDKHIVVSEQLVDYLRDIKNISAKNKSRIPTGYPQLDHILTKDGCSGWAKGYTYLPAQGLTGTGKTFILVNLARKQLMNNKKVLFISSEMDAAQIHDLFYRSMLLAKDNNEISAKIHTQPLNFNLAFIEYGRSSASTFTIEADISRLPWLPDIIFIDYLDILLPTRKYQQSWEAQAIVSDDLARLAQQFDVPIITGSQTNRSAAHEKRGGTKDFQNYETVGSSFNKTHQFAGIWNIRTNDMDYDSVRNVRKLDLICIKNREGQQRTSSFYLMYDYALLEENEKGIDNAAIAKRMREAGESISKHTIFESPDEQAHTNEKTDTYFERLKDDDNYKEDIKNIPKHILNAIQKKLLREHIEEYRKKTLSTHIGG